MNNIENEINIESVKKETSIMKAVRIGDIKSLKIILQSTSTINWNETNEEGQTALIVAIFSNQKESVKIICNASKNLEDAKLIKSHLLNFKFSEDQDLAYYAMHRINNIIFQFKLEEALISKIDIIKKLALEIKI